MAKVDKAISEEIPVGEAPAVIQEIVAARAEETSEQRDERLKREEYARRNEEAMKEREAILRRNGVLRPDEPFTADAEAAIRARCCP